MSHLTCSVKIIYSFERIIFTVPEYETLSSRFPQVSFQLYLIIYSLTTWDVTTYNLRWS